MQKSKKKLEFPPIPTKFPGQFPADFINSVKGWNFPQNELIDAARTGRMLTMDLDMPGKCKCSLSCKHCFNPVLALKQKRGELLSADDIKKVVTEAKSIGLRSVKIIGPGEPLEEKCLLGFLDFLAEQDIHPLIFTNVVALGDDLKSREVHGMDSENLAQKLKEVYSASILVRATSFHPETEAQIVGRGWQPAVRNLAIKRLVDAGYTEYVPGQPTDLTIIFNPIMRKNIDEVFEVYKWARIRNIYVISSPTMVAGKCRNRKIYESITPSENMLLDLYVKINLWAIEQRIYSFGDLECNGISAYLCARPCQQVGSGLFVRRDGLVLRCPGDDVSIQGNLKEKSLTEIWNSSDNLNNYRGLINVGCPPKEGKSFPNGFFEKVFEEIEKRISNTAD
jgi:MoaA/NifB/PqqE/SkfB family radical SAM enzyme